MPRELDAEWQQLLTQLKKLSGISRLVRPSGGEGGGEGGPGSDGSKDGNGGKSEGGSHSGSEWETASGSDAAVDTAGGVDDGATPAEAAEAADTAAAGPAVRLDDGGVIERLCHKLWGAALLNRNDNARAAHAAAAEGQTLGTQDLSTLLWLSDHKQLLKRLTATTVRALAQCCQAAGLTTAAAAAAAAAAAQAAGLGDLGWKSDPSPYADPDTVEVRGMCCSLAANAAAAAAAGSDAQQQQQPAWCGAPPKHQAAARAAEPAIVEAAAAAAAATAAAASGGSVGLNQASLLPVLQLLTTLSVVLRAVVKHAKTQRHLLDSLAYTLHLEIQLASGGLLVVLSALCDDLVPLLEQQQQQQGAAAQEYRRCLLLLSSAVVHALRFVYLIDRPAHLWWNDYLSPSVAPVVRLAAALQRHQAYDAVAAAPAPGTPAAKEAAAAAATAAAAAESAAGVGGTGGVVSAGSSDSTVTAARFEAWVALWREDSAVGHEPLALASLLTTSIVNGMGYMGLTPPLGDMLAMREMQLLLCVHSAATAQHLRNNLPGGVAPDVTWPDVVPSSSSSKSSSSSRGSVAAAAAAAAAAGSSGGGCACAAASSGGSSSSGSTPAAAACSCGSSCRVCHGCGAAGAGGVYAVTVPPWHEELYAAVGLPRNVDMTPVLVLWGQDAVPNLPCLNSLAVMCGLDAAPFWEQFSAMEGRLLHLPRGLEDTRQALQQGLLKQQQLKQQRGQQGEQKRPLRGLLRPTGPLQCYGGAYAGSGRAGGAAAAAGAGDAVWAEVVFLRQPKLRFALMGVLLQTLLCFCKKKVGVISGKLLAPLAIRGWCYDPRPTADAAVGGGAAAGLASSVESSLPTDTAGLLPSLLPYMWPVFNHLVSGGEQDPDVNAAALAFIHPAVAGLTAAALTADAAAGGSQLRAALSGDTEQQQQTQQQQRAVALLRVLEASVRVTPSWRNEVLTVDVPAITHALLQLYHPPTAAAAGTAPISSSSSGAVSALPLLPRGPELLTLLLSCVKVLQMLNRRGVMQQHMSPQQGYASTAALLDVLQLCLVLYGVETQQQAGEGGDGAAAAPGVGDNVAAAAAGGGGGGGGSATAGGDGGATAAAAGDGGGVSADAERWLWLAGRVLYSLCYLIADFTFWAQQAPLSAPPGFMVRLCEGLHHTITWMSELPSSSSSSSSNTTDLLDVTRKALNTTWPAKAGWTELGASGMMSMTFVGQVAGMGQELCDALPTPHACNNPSCCELDSLTEAAGVKGGRCSACKVAHYDCVGCQKQHRPRHKEVCNALKAQAQQQQLQQK